MRLIWNLQDFLDNGITYYNVIELIYTGLVGRVTQGGSFLRAV